MTTSTPPTPTGAPAVGETAGRSAATSLWRVEWLRLVRSPRALVLGGVYVFFGLLGPVLAKYLSQLAERSTGSVKIVVPPATAKDGMVSYISQSGQTGLIVVVVIAAGALALDSKRGLATFYRTRAPQIGPLIWPRYVVNALAAGLASVLGTLACWYGTVLLLGQLPAGAMLAGMLCSTVYLAFAVAVVAVAASFARSVLGTIGLGLGALLLLPVLAIWEPLKPWLPSSLLGAAVDLLGPQTLGHFLPALGVSLVAVPLLVLLAIRRLAAREV